MAQRFPPAFGHHLDRQAAVEIRRGFELVEYDLLAAKQRVDEGLVLRTRQRAVDVVGAGSRRPGLVVARLEPGDIEVDGLAMHDRRDSVEESECVFAGAGADCLGQRRRGEGTGGDDDIVPLGWRRQNLFAPDVDQRIAFERRSDGGGESLAIDGERPAGRQLVGVGCAHHQRAEPAHLRMQEADGAPVRIVRSE